MHQREISPSTRNNCSVLQRQSNIKIFKHLGHRKNLFCLHNNTLLKEVLKKFQSTKNTYQIIVENISNSKKDLVEIPVVTVSISSHRGGRYIDITELPELQTGNDILLCYTYDGGSNKKYYNLGNFSTDHEEVYSF